jgi:hypothetical protein
MQTLTFHKFAGLYDRQICKNGRRKSMKWLLTVFFLVMSSILGACGTQPPPATTPPSMGVEIQNIEEGEAISLDLKQVKRYDQCDSDSVLKTQIQFSQSDTMQRQKN